MYCFVPFSTLTAAPYLLSEGDEVIVKVVAVNAIGDSPASDPGAGAQIIFSTVPDSPIDLQRDPVTTTKTQIGLLWNAAPNDGG